MIELALALQVLATPCVVPKMPLVVIGPGNSASTPYKPSTTYKWLDSDKRNLSGLRMANVHVSVERMGVHLDNDQCDVIIKDTTILGTRVMTGDAFPAGVQIDRAGDVLLEGVQIRNFYMKPVEGEYNNGDGFVANNGSHDVTLRNVKIVGASDAGVDSKSVGFHMDRVTVEDVDLCFKLWRDATATNLTCRRAERGAIQLLWGASLKVSGTLRIEGGVDTIGLSKGASVEIARCIVPIKKIFYRDGGTPENTTLKLGAGCK